MATDLPKLTDFTHGNLVAIIIAHREAMRAFESRIAEQDQRIAALEEQIGLGGPPKSGGSKAPAIKPNRPEREGRERKKRKLNFFRRREKPTRTLDHIPETCPDCGRSLSGGGPKARRQVIDIPIVPVEIIEHVFHSRYCGACKMRVVARPDLSNQVSCNRRFGHNLTALIGLLHIEARVSLRTVQGLLSHTTWHCAELCPSPGVY